MEIERRKDSTVKGDDGDNDSITIEDYLTKLRIREKYLDSPVNLNITSMKDISLPDLCWNFYEVPPKKVKLNNSGHTVILCAKWVDERPFLCGGPFIGNYTFSQIHFHWGANDMEGSEHTVDGTQYPLEMHAVHFRNCYASQQTALNEKDGVAILVYFLKLQSQPNAIVQELIDHFPTILKANTALKIDAKPINTIIPCFVNDYFIYWGNIKTNSTKYCILWVVCRTPLGISADQLENFRSMQDANEDPILRNFRNIERPKKKFVYHVNSSPCKYSTLLPVPREEIPKQRRIPKIETETETEAEDGQIEGN